jgi:hypothetical protein
MCMPLYRFKCNHRLAVFGHTNRGYRLQAASCGLRVAWKM